VIDGVVDIALAVVIVALVRPRLRDSRVRRVLIVVAALGVLVGLLRIIGAAT